MQLRIAAVVLAALSIGLMAPAAHANPDSADLTVNISWAGKGTAKARVGETAPYSVTATNLGPDTAQQVHISLGLPDQLNPVSANCGSGTPASNSACDFVSLAPGESVTVSFVAVVCCFPKGDSRDTRVTGGVTSATPDPNLVNNFQNVPTRIIGGFGFSFPAP